MKLIEKKSFIAKFNCTFLATALVAWIFCLLIFPIIQDLYNHMAIELGVPTAISFNQCQWIAGNPIISALVFVVYYGISLWFFNQKINNSINIILLIYIAFIMVFLSMPISPYFRFLFRVG